MGNHVSRTLVQGRHSVFGAFSDGQPLVIDNAGPPRRVSTGLKVNALSAGENTVCTVSFDPRFYLQCLAQDTLREMWRAELPKEDGAYSELQQEADNVYVLAQGRTLAFNVATGKRLWATDEFRNFAPFKLVRGVVLTRNSDTAPEWRDPSSGEVIAPWKKQNRSFALNA